MKKGLLSIALLSGSMAMAQLPNGSVAPDWTLQDINGNTHSLYSDYLDNGYTVILDMSAAWCGPCWSYHTSGELEDLWMNHGPAGEPGVSPSTTNDVVVIMMECQASNTHDQLIGIQGSTGNAYADNTQGNWTTGVDYPIIDDASQNGPYAIAYFPTVYMICPNREVTEIGQQTAANLYSAVGGCPSAVSGTNMATFAYTGDVESCGGSINVSAEFQNMGTDPVSAFTAEVREGATVLATQSYSGAALNQYDFATLNFGNVTLTGNSVDVVITTSDAQSSDDMLTESIAVAGATSGSVEVSLLTDDYANETYLEIRNSSGTVVWSEGNEAITSFGTGSTTPPTDPTSPLANNTQYDWTVSLPAIDCYELFVGDFYGDGLGAAQWGGTDGTWTLKNNSGGTIATFTGDFGDTDKGLAENDVAGSTEDIDISNAVNVYPNPFSGNTTIAIDGVSGENVKVEVFGTVGQLISTNNYGAQSTIDFDATNLASGVYTLRILVGNKVATKMVTVR